MLKTGIRLAITVVGLRLRLAGEWSNYLSCAQRCMVMANFNKSTTVGIVLALLGAPLLTFGQTLAPDLGAVASFALFTPAGAMGNTGSSTFIVGDIGTDAGAISDYPPGSVVGRTYAPGTVTAQASVDVRAAYNYLLAVPASAGTGLAPAMGTGQILTPAVYAFGGAASIGGDLILDGQNNPNATFIFKVNGAFSTGASSQVLLINGAKPENVWWQVNGAASFAASTAMAGVVIAYGAVALGDGVSMRGQGLSTVGAISTYNNRIVVPGALTPLPVELTAFTAIAQGSASVAVAWNTATEVHSARFEVERSTNGTAFARIGAVAAAGSSSAPRAYSLVDDQLPAGVTQLYYRLRQVDTDGTTTYSSVRAVTRLAPAEAPLVVYPIPARDVVHVRTGSAVVGAPLLLFDGLGHLVRTQPAPAAGTEAVMPLADLPAGFYILRCGAFSQRLTLE